MQTLISIISIRRKNDDNLRYLFYFKRITKHPILLLGIHK